IEVDLTEIKNIGAIVTWGKPRQDQFVTSFSIKYRADEVNIWTDYADADGNTTLPGNYNQDISVLNNFQENILAQYVRLVPSSFTKSPTVRWELLGCAECKF
ncbi:hypothetical protein CAPTEDRAFT_129464, partial [Capitella teleta]